MADVTVRNPDGKLVAIDEADLAAATAAGYVRAAAPEPGFSFESIKAGARGALQGATAGLAEPIEVAGENFVGGLFGAPGAGNRYHEESKRLEVAHPTATAVGEGVGMIGGALTGEGLIAEGGTLAGNIGRGLTAINRAGEGAAAGVRALAGTVGRGALGRAAVTGAELGARGAIETDLYSGIHELSEEMLGKPELNGEKIFAAAVDGGEAGALLGVGLGAGGSLVRSGAKGLTGLATDALAKNADALQSMANEQRWRALDPLKKYTKQAEARIEGGVDAAGKVLKEYDITGNSIESAMREGHVGAIETKLDSAVEKVGKKLGELTDSSTAKIPWARIDDAIDEVVAPLRKQAGFENVVASLDKYKQSLAGQLVPETASLVTRSGESLTETQARALKIANNAARKVEIPLQDALFQRKALDQLVYQEAKALDPNLRVGLLRDIRSKFEGTIVDAFDEAATKAGNPGAKADLLKLKKDYQVLSLAQEAAADSSSRMVSNRNISLSDYMAGGFASHIGSSIGSVAGPVGTAAGHLVGGAVGAAMNRFGRERGNAIAALVLDRIIGAANERVLTTLEKAAPVLEREGASVDRLASAVPAPDIGTSEPAAPQLSFGKTLDVNGLGTDELHAAGKLTATQLSQVKDAIAKEPRAVAQLVEGERRVGKEFLMQSGGWHGYLPVESTHAAMLDKAAEFERAKSAIAHVDLQVEKAARGIVGLKPSETRGSPYRMPAGEKGTLSARFDKARRDVETLQQRSQELVDRVTRGIPSMPNTSNVLGMTALRAAAYLVSSLPSSIQQNTLGQDLPARVTTAEMHDYMQKFNTARSPMFALRQFERGRMTQGMADTLRVVSPEIFTQLQSRALIVVNQKQAAGKPLPFDARQRMATLLGIITDPCQAPKMTANLQSNVAHGPDDKSSGPGSAGGTALRQRRGRPLDTSNMMSHFDQVEGRAQ